MPNPTLEQLKTAEKLATLHNDPKLAIFDELQGISDTLKEIATKEIPDMPSFPKEISVGLKGVSVVTIKGDKGDKPVLGEDYPIPKDGYTPVKGKDYFTDKEIAQITKNATPVKGKDYRDGIDGITPVIDTDSIALEASKLALNEIKPSIPTIDDIENDLPKLGTQIRDALELLQDDERLDVSAIKGLTELIKKLTPEQKQTVVGGAPRTRFMDDETPTGAINSVNTVFYTSGYPLDSSLKVYVNGQRMRVTEDYTLSNKTITFVTAPPTTSIILCDYRY